MSSSDIWHPKHPAKAAVAIFGFAMTDLSLFFLPFIFYIRTYRPIIIITLAYGLGIADSLLYYRAHRADISRLIGLLKVCLGEGVGVGGNSFMYAPSQKAEGAFFVNIP
jgi:hypothetical protein